MLPFLQKEMAKEGLKEEEIIDFFSLGQSLPGVIAINCATLTGRKLGGFWGAFWATAGVIAPSYLIIAALAAILQRHLSSSGLQGALSGIRACAAALILISGAAIAKRALLAPSKKGPHRLSALSCFLFAGVLILLPLGANPFALMLGAAGLSLLRSLLQKKGECN